MARQRVHRQFEHWATRCQVSVSKLKQAFFFFFFNEWFILHKKKISVCQRAESSIELRRRLLLYYFFWGGGHICKSDSSCCAFILGFFSLLFVWSPFRKWKSNITFCRLTSVRAKPFMPLIDEINNREKQALLIRKTQLLSWGLFRWRARQQRYWTLRCNRNCIS